MRKLLCSLVLFAAAGGLVAAAAPAPAQQKDKKDVRKDDKKSDDKKGAKKEKDAAKVEVYQGKDGWRFRVVGPDGKTVAIGVQGFAKKDDCLAAVETLKAVLGKAKVGEVPKE
jgi:uncharacterized protein YegP (UPF0339 family)